MEAAPDKVLAAGMYQGNREARAETLPLRLGGAETILWFGAAQLARLGSDAALGDSRAALASAVASLPAAARRGVRVIVCSEEDRGFAAPPGLNLHISSGPRAFAEYLERLSLPGITALDPADRRSSPN